ncbi:MAG: hypothetical protein KDD90_07255 [Sphingomonadaceae bacterium]|nr:hypothetical protein [Sphingomonadaceae bacterium]
MFSLARKPSRRTGSNFAMAIALATGTMVATAGIALPAYAKEKKNDKEPKADYSKGFVAAYTPVDKLSKAGDNEAAEAQLDGVVAAAVTDDDKNAAGGLVYNVGVGLDDTDLQRRGLKLMLDSGRLDQAKTGQFNYTSYQLAFQDNEYDVAREFLAAAIDADYSFSGRLTDGTTRTFAADDLRMMLADIYFDEEDFEGGLGYIRTQIANRVAAGQTPPRDWLMRARAKAYNNDLALPAIEFANEMVRYYPDTQNWRDAINIQRNLVLMDGPELLDLMRLGHRLGTLETDRDYLEYADSAEVIRAPGEVKRILDEGIAKGLVNRSEPAVSDVLNAANSSVDADKRDLPNLEKEAMAASASTKFATNAADAFLSYEQYEKAEALYQNALGRPGVDAALANMRLGIAQLSLGKLEDAKASFAKVTGQRRPVAALWTVYADQLAKESGTSAEAAAEAASEI